MEPMGMAKHTKLIGKKHPKKAATCDVFFNLLQLLLGPTPTGKMDPWENHRKIIGTWRFTLW